MAESICRALRDGALEGEHAPALTIKDSINAPLGFDVFAHVLAQLSSHILAGKSQSRGLVLVAFTRSPSFYVDLLKERGLEVNSSRKWIQILDCYSDPHGWKDRIMGQGKVDDATKEASGVSRLCKDVKDMDKLCSLAIELGKGLLGEGKGRFSFALDSVNEMLRYASVHSVARVLSDLRSHDLASCVFWLLHSDLLEDKVAAVFDYMSSMVASLESAIPASNGLRISLENLSLTEQNFRRAKFSVRFKRRNGRVRLMSEEVSIERSGITFSSVSTDGGTMGGSLLPKVQFNLQLSEKEQMDRAKVVLPFEHQGNGEPIEIYDGRRSLADKNNEVAGTMQMKDSSKGEIIYLRDSDDEMPDSDEDPDDDLDI